MRDEKAVGALQGVWIGLNLFYAGFVIVPQNFLPGLKVGLWINATRYALEGIVFSSLDHLTTNVQANYHTPFYFFLECNSSNEGECYGTMQQYVDFYFGGEFSSSNRGLDLGMLGLWNVVALCGTWFCLKKFNYTNT